MTSRPSAETGTPGRPRSGATPGPLVAVWVALSVGLPALVVALSPLSSVDLAYGIRAGQQVLDGSGIPGLDTFTFTAAGMAWIDQQWLAQAVFGVVYRLGGWAALQVFWVGVVAAAVGLTARAAFVSGAGIRTSVVVTLAGFTVAAQGLGLRAQVLGLLCLATLLLLVAQRGDRPAMLWLAVPVVAIWTNVHGSFVVGIALLATAIVTDRRNREARRRDVAVLIGATLATLASPYGIDAWRYVATIGTDPTISALVTEWRHTDPLQPAGALFYASVVGTALIVAVVARRRTRPNAGSLLWLGMLGALGAWALRAVAWWGIGAAPSVARLTSTLTGAPTDRSGLLAVPGEVRRRRVTAAAACAVVLALAGGLALAVPAEGRLEDAPPGIAAAVRSIAAQHQGVHVFDAQRWGSWLELQAPDARYFADSRIELIPSSAWQDYGSVSSAQPGWQATLDRWQVDAVALSYQDQPSLVAAIMSSSAWRVVHRDADGIVAVRA